MTTLEQTIETIKAMPPADRRQLREWLQVQERPQEELDAAPPPAATTTPVAQAETVEQQIARFRKAMDWIHDHRAEYLGQWVVLVGDRLISHGFDSRQVDQAAKAAGIEVPFIALVGEEPEAFMTYMVGLP